MFCDEGNWGVEGKRWVVIDDLIDDIRKEYNMRRMINREDMKCVMGIGERIL